MSKNRTSKGQLILVESMARVEAAREVFRNAETALAIADAVLQAQMQLHTSLVASFARADRRLPKPEVAKKGTVAEPICGVCGNGTEEQSSYSSYRVVPRKSSRKETVATPICGLCGNSAEHSDHDKAYLSSHPFAPVAAKKSSRKGAAKDYLAESEPILAASASGD